MTFEEWLKVWKPDIWHTRAYNRKLLLAVKSASSKLQVMKNFCNHLKSYMPFYPPLTFEVTPDMVADPEGLALLDIENLVKPWMKEHWPQLEKEEQLFAQKYAELAKYMLTLDKLLAAPFSEADYLEACKRYPMSESEYREAERLAGILLFLSNERHVITIRLPDSPGAYYTPEYLPNSLVFQWMNKIRYEEEWAEEWAKDDVYAMISDKSKPLTDPSNERVWLRAIGEWQDNTRFVRDSGQSVCDFCAGPCGDCPQRWSNDPDSCDHCNHEYEEFTECTNCPCRPDLFRHMERDVAHKSPYEAILFPKSCYPGSVPLPPPGYYPGSVPPPAPDSVPAGYGPQPQPAQN